VNNFEQNKLLYQLSANKYEDKTTKKDAFPANEKNNKEMILMELMVSK